MYDEHSTYSSTDFLMKLIHAFRFPIREVQTDNGTEFTTALLVKDRQAKSLFENALDGMGIICHRIRVATPRHNGKVERQPRIDEKRASTARRGCTALRMAGNSLRSITSGLIIFQKPA